MAAYPPPPACSPFCCLSLDVRTALDYAAGEQVRLLTAGYVAGYLLNLCV
jgi:hypothetical protein